jgi:hypothetical protein
LGEGLLLESQSDCLDHSIEIPDHLMIPEAKDALAIAFEPARADRIDVGIVLPAVQFDYKPSFDAQEINDIVPIVACRRNFAPSNCRSRSADHSRFSTSVASCRNRLAWALIWRRTGRMLAR